ncbi:unnamed protein product [Thlaspi arvense]|uniref:TOD1/MUCI70 glycosyltransferase-like domain-containing protein n=1 Tax=Thlaspi arvense TaxID=13288 RepID=A0AAU9S220_THLAR|nr:unnamed protein product [Thlaspi arvense]
MGSVSPALFGLSLFLLKLPACLILRWIHTSAIAVLQNKRLNKYNYSAIDEQFIFYRSDGLKKFDPSDPNSPLPNSLLDFREGTKLEWRGNVNHHMTEEVVKKTRSFEKVKSEAEKCLAQGEKFVSVLNTKKAKLRALRDKEDSGRAV